MKKRIQYNKNLKKDERPFYIVEDNAKSSVKVNIEKKYNKVDDVTLSIKECDRILSSNYFDTEFIKKQKENSLDYPTYERTKK